MNSNTPTSTQQHIITHIFTFTTSVSPLSPPSSPSSSFANICDQGLEHNQAFDGALKGLESYGMLVLKKIETKTPVLLPDGQAVLQNGSPEYQVFQAVPAEGGISKPDLDVSTCMWVVGMDVEGERGVESYFYLLCYLWLLLTMLRLKLVQRLPNWDTVRLWDLSGFDKIKLAFSEM